MSYSEELYNKIVAEPALTNESTYDEFLANIEDPEQLKNVYFKAKYFDPYNTPSTIEEFSELLKKKEEGDFGGLSQPSEQDIMPVEETTSQIPTVGSELIDPNSPLKANISVPMAAVGVNQINNASINQEEQLGVEAKNQAGAAPQAEPQMPQFQDLNLIQKAKSVANNFKNTYLSPLAQADADVDRDMEEVEDEVNLDKRKPKKKATRGDVKNAANELLTTEGKIDAVNRRTYEDAKTALGKLNVYGIKVDGDEYQMIYTHPDRATDIGVIYDGTVGDASWKGYVESRYQAGGIPSYNDDESWQDLKEAVVDIEGYDISNLRGDSNQNSLNVNLTSHKRKYGFEEGVGVSIPSLEIKRDKDEDGKNKQGFFRDKLERVLYTAKTQIQLTEKAKQEAKEFQTTKDIETATMYIPEAESNFFEDIYNNPTTNEVGKSIGIVTPAKLMFGADKDLIKEQIKYYLIQNGQKDLSGESYSVGENYQPTMEEQLKGRFSLQQSVDMIYNNMVRDAQFHFGRAYIEREGLRGNQELGKKQTLEKLNYIQKNSLDTKTDRSDDPAELALMDFGIQIFDAAKNDYKSHYEAKAGILTKTSQYKGTSGRINALNARILDISKEIEGLQSKYKLPSEEESKNIQARISDRKKKLDELAKERDALLVDVEGEYFKDEASSARGAEIEKEMQSLTVTENGQTFWKDEASQKRGEELQKELAGLVEKKKGKGYKDKDAEAKYNELESQMQTLIDEISQDDALFDPARKFSEEVNSKVEKARRLEAKMNGIASSSEELNTLKGLQDQLDAIDQYNSMGGRTELDGFSRRRKDVEYEQANLKREGENDNAVEAFTKGMFGGIASTALGFTLTAAYINPATGFLTESEETFDSADMAKLAIGQMIKDVSQFQRNPYYKDWSLNSISAGVGGVVPDLIGVALTGGGSGIASLASKYGLRKAVGKIATSPTTLYFTMRSTGERALMYEKAGYSPAEALAFGAAVSHVEAMLESLIPEFGSSSQRIAIKSSFSEIIEQGVKNNIPVEEIAKQLTSSFFESAAKFGYQLADQGKKEGVEEGIQGVFGGTADALITGRDASLYNFSTGEFTENAHEVLFGTAIGFITGVGTQSVQSYKDWVSSAPNRESVKLVQLTIGKDYKGIYDAVVKENKDLKDNEVLKHYEKISQTYNQLENNPTFKNSGELEKSEILDRTLALDDLLKSQKELASKGVVDSKLNADIEAKQKELSEILEVSANHTEQRNELNEKLKALGIEGYNIGSDGTVNDIKVSPQIPQDQMESVIKQATEIIETTYKPKEDAVQKSEAGQVPVQPEAAVGEQMEEGTSQAEPQTTTEEGGQPKIEAHEMGEFDEEYANVEGGISLDEGYLKNNFFASPLKQISSVFKHIFSDKKTKEKGVSAYIFKPKSAPKRTSETQLDYNNLLRSTDEIIETYQDGNGKNDEKIIKRAKEAGLTDEVINKIIEVKNSMPESTDKKERYENSKKAFAQAENIVGEFMSSQGIESSDIYAGAEEEARQEGDLPKQYRFFGGKGNTVLGAVDITPEIAERLSDETLTEEEKGRILAEAAGIEYDPDAFVHLNTTSVSDYAKKNNLKLQGETKVEGQENIEEESLTDEEWNGMISDAESLGSDIEQVSQNVKQDTRKSKIVQQIKKGAKSLSSIFPNMKIVVHENNASYNKAMDVLGGRKNTRGQFVYMPTTDGNYTGAIHINLERANGRTVPHEITHAVMLKLFGENAEIFKNFREKIKDLAKGRTVKIKDAEGNIDEVSWDDLASDLADRYEDNERGEEYLAELTGIMNDIDLEDKESRNIFQKIADFVNNFISKYTGLKAIDDTSSAEDVLEFFEGLSGKISRGENIKVKEGYVDKNDKPISNKDITYKLQNDFTDSKTGFSFEYLKNSNEFKDLEEKGNITNDQKLSDFNGSHIIVHQPDGAFSGNIYKTDSETGERYKVVDGKGGIFYPIKFFKQGYFWASTRDGAAKLAALLNDVYAKNNGKILMALTVAPKDKLLSSTLAANAVIDIFKSKQLDKKLKLSEADVKNALIKGAKSTITKTDNNGKQKIVGLNIKNVNQKMTFEEIENIIREKLSPDNSSFGDRKTFVESFVSSLVDNIKNKKSEQELGKFFSESIGNVGFKGKYASGYKLSKANVLQSISEMMLEPMLKYDDKNGSIYAILEVDSEVELVETNEHPSYPYAIKAKNGDVVVNILQDRLIWDENVLNSETGESITKEESLKIMPTTAGISFKPVIVNSKSGPKTKSQLSEDVDSFFDEIETIFPNDDIRGGYAVTNENGDYIGRVSMSAINDNTVKIDEVVSKDYGQRTGNGSTIMKMVTDVADKNGITLKLMPNLILDIKAKGFETADKLKSFYEKFGFVKDSKLATMTRQPKQAKGPRVKAQIDINAEESPLYKKRNKEDLNFVSNERVEQAILNNQVPSDQVKRYKNAKPLQEGEVIGARLNLTGTALAGFEIMSIHEGLKAKGKVKTYRGNVTLKNVQFIVEQGVREAIVTGKRDKEPMAVAAGEYTTKEANFDGIEVKFNPKKLHLFVDSEGRAIKSAEEVTIMGHRAYARGKITYYEEFEDPRNEKYTAPSEVKFAKTKEELIGIAEDLRSGEIVPEDLGITEVSSEELADTLESVAETIEEGVDAVEAVKSIPNKKEKDDVETLMAKIIAANVKSRMDVGGKSQEEVMKLALIDYLKSEGAKGNLSEAADSMMQNYPTLMAKVNEELNKSIKKEKAKVRAEMTPEQKQLQDLIKREAKAALEGKKEGLKEGKAEGIEKGKEAGRKEGFKEGKKEGKAEGKEMGRKEGVVAGRKVGFFEGIFKGISKAESTQRTVAKAVRGAIDAFRKTGKISDVVARQLVKRAVGITTENELTDYMNFVSEVLANNEIATALNDIKKLQKQALKKKTYQYFTTIRQFAKIPLFKNRNLLFDYDTLEQYRDALQKLVEGKVPDISRMNGMHSSGTSLFNYMSNVASSNKKGFDITQAQQVVSDILQGVYFKPFKINNIDDYRTFKRQVSKLRRNLGQLLAKGAITQVDYDNAMGKLVDLDATYETYTQYYQNQIDAIKKELIKDIFDNQIKDVVDFMNNNPDVFTEPQKELIRKLAGMNSSVLSDVLDIEDADTLKEVVDSMEDGFVDESSLRRILSKAEIRGNKVGEKLNAQLQGVRSKYKKGDIGFKLFRDLMTKAVVFWESQLGLSEKGTFWNYVSQPITRAINQWNKLYDDSIRQFMSDVKGIKFSGTTEVYDPISEKNVSISNETYSRIKIGLIGHILDNAWKKVNSPQTSTDLMNDWLGDILKNKAIAINFQKGGDYNLAVVMDIYKKLAGAYSNDNGGINQEALLQAYEKGGKSRENILSKAEQEYYDALRRQFETTSEYVIAANSMRQQNSETNPYYMPRSYFSDTRNKRVSADVNKDVSGKPGQRASATYERIAGLPYEALEFNVDKLLNTHLEEVYRDYSLTEAKVFVNEVFANARDNAKTDDEIILLDQLQELAKGRIDFALEDAANLEALSSVTKLFVTNTLIGVKRTPVEFLNNLIAYSSGNRSSKAITLPFNKKELEETDNLLRRFNSSIYSDAPKRQIGLGKRVMEKLRSGKMDAKLKQEAAINLIYPYLNNTTSWMRKGEWKSNFDRAFKELTGEKFSYGKHFNDPAYNQAMTEAANSADFNMRRIMKGGNKSEQLQYVKVAPEWIYKLIGNKRKERGMYSMNSYSSLFLTLYTGFIGHDVTNIEEGFRKTVTGKEIKDGLKQMSGAAFRLSLYPTLMVVADALLKAYYGDDEEKKEGEETLNSLSTPEGWSDLFKTLATQMASTYVSGKYGNIAKLIGSVALDAAYTFGDDNQKKMIKSIMRELYFTDPLDFKQSSQLAKDYIYRTANILTPMLGMVAKEIEETVEDLQDKSPYEKVTVGDLIEYFTKDEEGASAWQLFTGMLMLGQGLFSAAGTPIPFVDDFVRMFDDSVKNQGEINNRDMRTTFTTSTGQVIDMTDLLLNDKGRVDINIEGLTREENEELSDLATEKFNEMVDKKYGILSPEKNEEMKMNVKKYSNSFKSEYNDLQNFLEKAKFEAMKELGFNVKEWNVEEEIYTDKSLTDFNSPSHENDLIKDILKGKHLTQSQHRSEKEDMDKYIQEEFSKYEKKNMLTPGGKNALEEYYKAKYINEKYQLNSPPREYDYIKQSGDKIIEMPEKFSEVEKELMKEKNREYRENKE